MQRHKVFILINEGFSDNYGDQLIRISVEHLLGQFGAEVKFFDLSGNNLLHDATMSEFDNNKNKIIQNIKSYIPGIIKVEMNKLKWKLNVKSKLYNLLDQNTNEGKLEIIFGGGQLFQSNAVFPYYISELTKIAEKKGVEYHLYGVGVGPILKKDEKIFGNIFKKASKILVRDCKSKSAIFELSGRSDVKVFPDPVHIISNIYRKSEIVKRKCFYGIIDIEHLKKDGRVDDTDIQYNVYKKDLEDLINIGFDVYIFGTTKRDIFEAKKFLASLEGSILRSQINLVDRSNLNDFLNKITSAELIVSARMHALIIAKSFGIEFKPLIISEKINSYINDLKKDGDIRSIKCRIIESIDYIV